MEKKYLKNSIISFVLILSTVLSPLSFIPKKAEAQSVGGYAAGLGGAILTLPQCNIIGGTMDAVKNLFSSNPALNLGNLGSVDDTFLSNDPFATTNRFSSISGQLNLQNEAESAAQIFDSVNVNISETPEGKAILDTYEKTTRIEKSTASINQNSTCIQSIGRLIIKMLLQKLTVSTIAWINSGFDGQPAFIQDPGKFFSDIAKNEVLQFGLEINDPELFPFGKAWMRNTAEAFNSKFQDNARYSLDKLIQNTNPEYSALTFYQDFSQGGWNAWTAMTQAPQNNPLGFQLMADNELQRRLEGTTQSTAEYVHDALQAANGFLGDQRCVDPEGLTKSQHDAGIRQRSAGNKSSVICNEWQYVTPGSLVASAATTAMGYENNAYLNVEDLNDAVAAILDALLGQFSSTIMEKGFANYGDAGSDGKLLFKSGSTDRNETQIERDFIPSQLTSSWLSANPNFNIRTDLTQALIDEQRTYADKLALQNKELLSTIDGKPYDINGKVISNSYGLIPVINQLDYCIPGPHPGWEQDSRTVLNAVTNTITPETKQSLEDMDLANVMGMAQSILPLAGAAIGYAVLTTSVAASIGVGATIGSAFPVVGTIIGGIVGLLIGSFLFGDDGDGNVRAYYAVIIQSLTGYLPDYEEDEESLMLNLASKSGAVNVLNSILDRYGVIINKIYYSNQEILPTVAKESTSIYNQLKGYGQMMKNNENKISSLKSTISILGNIKEEVTKLNNDYPKGGEEYESKLKTQINAFGRLSASMVNGADIANADSLYKQIIDKKEYIYKNLLKGPYGCEAEIQAKSKRIAELEAKAKNEEEKAELASLKFPYPWQGYDINSVKRMTYPFPILYDYNLIPAGADISDPWNYCTASTNPDYPNCKTKMPSQNSSFGPGFLSFVMFANEGGGTYASTNVRNGPERLPVLDLFPTSQNVPKNNGLDMKGRPVGLPGGPWETAIGIY